MCNNRLPLQHVSQPKGFTLIEVLMAVMVLGVFFAIMIIALDPTAQSDSELEQQAIELDALLEQVGEDALLMNVQYGLRLHADGYDVLQHGQIETASGPQPAWLPLENSWSKKRLSEQYVISMSLNDAAMETPAKANDSTNDDDDDSNATNSSAEPILPPPPHILLLSSGETTQAIIRITDTENKTAVYVALDPLGRAVTRWQLEPDLTL